MARQKEGAVSSLRESRREKLETWYLSRDQRLTAVFDANSRARNLNQVTQVTIDF